MASRFNNFSPACLVGIDEVGRGPLAGPVTVCACAVPADFDFTKFAGIRDSKKLSPKKREEWHAALVAMKDRGEIDFAFASVDAVDIDRLGIATAIRDALELSLGALRLDPTTTQVMLDGSLRAPDVFTLQETIIKGDDKVPVISAASIIAKVVRDRHMDEMAVTYPGYGLEKHKGYGTAVHREALQRLGPTPFHRLSFLGNIL